MASSLVKYISLFYKLLPKGKAWNRSPASNMYKLISAYSPEWKRVDDRVSDLLRESNPITCQETLSSWEKLFGLPDNCTENLNLTFEQRRNIVIQRFVARGGSNAAYFEKIAAIFGYPDVKCSDYKPFRSGKSQSGDQISGEGWEYVFKLFSPNAIINNFKSGSSQSGDQIRTFGNPAMECIIRRVKPAHTTVIFSYGTAEA